jgi:serine protease Do
MRTGIATRTEALLAAALILAFAPAAAAGEPPKAPEPDPDIELAVRLERAFQKVAAQVQPCVVSLTVHTKGGDWRDDIARLQDRGGLYSLERRFTASGVILEEDGLILTNEHVVRGAEQIRARLHDGTVFKAKVAGSDPRSDIALLRPVVPLKSKLSPARLANSDLVAVGQWALAIGNPFDLSNTLTVGVVSARGRSVPARSMLSDVFYANLIQTDAAINPGNSGGPLFNLHGELIGINTMIFSQSGRSEGFGFAIPTNDIVPRLEFLKSGRPVEYGWLGVRLRNLEPDQEAFPETQAGAIVEEVLRDTPADRAGIKQGSRILAYDGAAVPDTEELMEAVGRTQVGKVVKVKVCDPEGRLKEVPVRIGLRPPDLLRLSSYAPVEPAKQPEAPNELAWRGLRVRELTDESAAKSGARLQVLGVRKGSPADRAGFYEGALVDEFKSAAQAAIQRLESLAQFRRLTLEASGAVYLRSPLLGYVQVEAE